MLCTICNIVYICIVYIYVCVHIYILISISIYLNYEFTLISLILKGQSTFLPFPVCNSHSEISSVFTYWINFPKFSKAINCLYPWCPLPKQTFLYFTPLVPNWHCPSTLFPVDTHLTHLIDFGLNCSGREGFGRTGRQARK